MTEPATLPSNSPLGGHWRQFTQQHDGDEVNHITFYARVDIGGKDPELVRAEYASIILELIQSLYIEADRLYNIARDLGGAE